MTFRQKRIVAILTIANVAVILILATLLLRPFDAGDSPLPTPELGPLGADAPPQEDCQWQAAQILARTGPGGTVALTPDGLLRFELTHSLLVDEMADEAAQLVWGAFDAALALQELECEFTRVEVTVLAVRLDAHGQAQGDQSGAQIGASVGADDLAAFGAGELSEDEFIELVTYTISPLP